MVIVAHQPMYNPSVWFEWEPMYFNWYIVAWIVAAWFLATRPYATDATVYRRKRTRCK